MKILFIHASAGAGHFKAAEALYGGVKKLNRHDVVFVDALDYSSPFFKKLYTGTYFFLISKMPRLWGWCFGVLDIACLQPLVRFVRRVYNGLNTRKLHQFLCDEQFDYIFSTHFLSTEVSCALKRSGKIASRVVTIITDYDVHKIWLADGVDHYVVATDWTKGKLRNLGVDENRILACGIPTDQKFSVVADTNALKMKLGLPWG